MEKLNLLQTKLNLRFKNPKILLEAFTHKSYLNESRDKNLQSNERLEFLGDSILSFTVAKYFYNLLNTAKEGELTELRSKMVQTKTLALAAKKLNLGEYLLISKGEERTGGRQNETLLANVFEALIGAIFIDLGLENAENFIIKHLLKKYQYFINLDEIKDYKSLLQQVIQNKWHLAPYYKTISENGKAHEKIFKVAVFANDRCLGEGKGKSKQQAEQMAAKKALESRLLK